LIEQERVTVKHGVPTMFILELNHPQFKRFTLSSLRTGIVAAAACPVEIVRRIRTEMGCDIVICYGLSETSATLTATDYSDDDLVRSETCGKALPGAEVKIVDANRQQLPPGEVGEVVCRGFGVMKGYYNLPEETRQALDEDGWFYTGDLGTLDDKGYLRIVGRKKEMIIRGGYNIYPREVEEVFYTHPGVMEIAIVGLPDTVLGEISCAAIKLKPGKTATEEEMKSFIKQRVANYKVPDKIVFVDEFPMTASGKIKKVEMQVQLKERLGAELR
jgi:acyl-CoA synthetase (AMP-forming)/AMP-acid ligase II